MTRQALQSHSDSFSPARVAPRGPAVAWPREPHQAPGRTQRRDGGASHLLTLLAPSPRRSRAQHRNAAYGTVLAVCKFMAWAQAQAKFPTPEAVQTEFDCSRATAYRWLNALAEAYCIAPPWRDAEGNLHPARS